MLPLHAYRECHVDTTTTADSGVWLCSSSLTHAVHILTRPVLGETQSDKSPNGAKHEAELCVF